MKTVLTWLSARWEWVVGAFLALYAYRELKQGIVAQKEAEDLREVIDAAEEKKNVEEFVGDLSPDDIDRVFRENGWYRR